jgi:hypothetical protein
VNELSLTPALLLAAGGMLRYVRVVLGGACRVVAFRLVIATLAVRRVCPHPPVR